MPNLPVTYTVTATLPNAALAVEFIHWLANGHLAAVITGGAQSAQVVRHDPADGSDGEPTIVEVRYLFASRPALETYLSRYAPALRAEGLQRFGPGTGIVFHRTIGVLAHQERA